MIRLVKSPCVDFCANAGGYTVGAALQRMLPIKNKSIVHYQKRGLRGRGMKSSLRQHLKKILSKGKGSIGPVVAERVK